ncbi:MAG: hypothetical protein WCR30_04290 [Clostridia bacterium]
MKTKVKIVTTVFSILLALTIMTFAVYAASIQTLIVTNSVSFVSEHVLATVTGWGSGASLEVPIYSDYCTVDKNLTMVWNIGTLSPETDTSLIVLSILVRNDSSERYLAVSYGSAFFTGQMEGNVTRICKVNNVDFVSGEMEIGTINPTESMTIEISLTITDIGKNAHFNNDFAIELINVV